MPILDESTLVALVDGELDADTAREVEAALAANAEAQETVRRLRQSAALTRAVFNQEHYLGRPVDAARVLSHVNQRPARRHALVLAAAACLALAAFGSGFWARGVSPASGASADERLLGEIADYHVFYAHETEHQVEVRADRRANIEAWLGRRLHRHLQIPDLSNRGLQFAGARQLAVDGAPVAQLLYHWPGHDQQPLGLCITFGPPGDKKLTVDARDGVEQVLWRRNGYTYILVGWASEGLLSSLASQLMAELSANL